MSSKKLGALIRSVPPATMTRDTVAAEQPDPPPVAAKPVLEAPTELRTVRPVKAIEAEVPFQVLIPESIRKQLGHMAAEEGQSLRALALRAFRSLGIDVTDAQIKGKRGR
jgi:hypothetical protein